MKISFCFEALEFQRYSVLRPSKVRKLVRTNQFPSQKYENGYRTKICDFTVVVIFMAGCALVFGIWYFLLLYSHDGNNLPIREVSCMKHNGACAEAILACHPALSTEWVGWVAKWCELWCTTLAKKIETGTHIKLQARACSRDHAPVPAGVWLSQFFWPG